MHRVLAGALLAATLLGASPTRAQWTREAALPAADVYALSLRGDTLLAGVDQAVWKGAGGGTAWTRSADLPGPPISIDTVHLERGRLWAGTYGRGVFTSANLGQDWQPFNPGLTGGIAGSHLYVTDFAVRGDSLFAATDGAGVYALPLHTLTAWSPVGTNLVANAAGGVADLECAGDRLVACSGGNGFVHHNDRGDADWTVSYLNNTGISPGLQPSAAAWTGSAWLVAAQAGAFRSAAAVSPWSAVGPALGSRFDGRLATRNGRTFGAWNSSSATTYVFSHDDGTHWQVLETIPGYTYEMVLLGTRLDAGRSDGLWWREVAAVDVPVGVADGVRLERAGAHPAGALVRLRFVLPVAAAARVAVFDARGREVARPAAGTFEAGVHEVSWRPVGATPGVYFARLEAAGSVRTVRLVVLGAGS